jgi:Tol biopolymer transport system component
MTVLMFVFVFQGNGFAKTNKRTIKPNSNGAALLTHIEALTPTESFMAPQWSPDGIRLSFSKEKFDTLFVADMEQKSVKTLVQGPFVGYAAKWSADGGQLYFRKLGQEFTATLTQAVTLDGKNVQSTFHSSLDDVIRLSVKNDQIYVEQKSAQAFYFNSPTLITDQKDQYFAPVLSPDGKYVCFEGIVSGIYIMHLETGETIHVGRGNHPVWSFDGQLIVFDKTEDDGRQLTGGELFLYDLNSNDIIQLTDTKHIIEQHPALSPDNSKVAFDAGGAIFVGTMDY